MKQIHKFLFDMLPGTEYIIPMADAKRVRQAMCNYAKRSGKGFRSKRVKGEQTIRIIRVA